MSDGVGPPFVRPAVTATALCLAIMGVALLFAGDEVGRLVFGGAVVEPQTSLYSAALLGYAAMNWIARSSTLGGIYGRAVVAANQVHFTIGAIGVVKQGAADGGSAGFWIVAAVYLLGAALFTLLTLGPGIVARREP